MFPKHVIEYINPQRVSVLSLEMLDGSPYGSTVHFAYDPESNVFLFETSLGYKKSEVLLGKEKTRASLVIGVDESNMKTLQIDGESRLLKDDEKDLFDKVYFAKFPDKKEKNYGKPVVLFLFTPTWWRFTDWTGPDGKVIIGTDY